MNNPDINKLIDSRSQALWDKVSLSNNISLKFHTDPNYMCFSLRENSTIYIAENNYNKDWFAHELLHLLLSTKEINIGSYIKARFRENALLSSVLSEPLIEHITNTLDHSKMLQYYLELGFDRTQFIMDYDVQKCTDEEINIISISINSNSLWKLSADLFIGKFFAVKSCPNIKINYKPYLKQLQNLDNTLFTILNKFWNSWLLYDIEKYDINNYNYWDFCDTFYSSLNEWAQNRNQE